ncbi:lysylphosphatidylglycerol synthase domain-containing protein [Halobacteriovorax sp. DPLXC-1]|uniref:lysylphosphatidylglycerol synthase domain-containing protein n=1 Tax=Halobacteriovorax sp. DPLXC-1 TaxID=3110771 RepID=UPI002FF1D125
MNKVLNILRENIFLIKLTIVLSALFYIYFNDLIDWNLIKKGLSNPKLILVFLLLTFLQQLVGSARTKSLLFYKNEKLNVFKINNITWASTFLNCVLPTSIAGEVYKINKIIDNSDNEIKDNVVYTALVSKVLTVISLVIISFTALFSSQLENKESQFFLNGLILFCFILCLLFTYRLKLYKLAHQLYKKINIQHTFIKTRAYNFHIYFNLLFFNPSAILKPLLLSIILQILNLISILLIVYNTKEVSVNSLIQLSQVIPLGIFASILPISYQGLGTGNYAFNELFKLVNIKNGSDIFTIYFALSYIFNLIGIIPFILFTLRKK